MSQNNNFFPDRDEFSSDIRADRNEEFFLNLQIKLDKKLLGDLAAFFGGEKNGEYPLGVKKLLGGKLPFDVYMANSSSQTHPGSINMVLATDTSNKYNKELTEELDNMTLSIYGFNTQDWFTVTSIRKVPAPVGTLNNRVLRAEIVFFYNHSVEADNIGDEILNRIFALPNIFDETKILNQRIAHWEEYLKINEDYAEKAQVLMDYTGCRKSDNISQIIFSADVSELNSTHNNSDIQLVTGIEHEYGHPIYKGPVIGTINCFNQKTGEITVDMEFEFMEMLQNGSFKIPHSAKLFVTKWGDLVQLRRLRYGLNTFARGQAENPMLDVFIFDSSKARPCNEPREILKKEEMLQPNLNDEQHRAVEGVINSPDLYLIQGPPGTGKTTVIAEICYQNAIRGLKTLIASQTNLAVDNALGKLIHHPKIRALRKGNEQSVQEEGKLFTENNVIRTWLNKTSSDCNSLLSEKKNLVDAVDEAQRKLDGIIELYKSFNLLNKKLGENVIKKASLDHKTSRLRSALSWLNVNFTAFLQDVKSEGYINLIENPYGAEDEFIETIKEYHATKLILDDKIYSYKTSVSSLKKKIRTLQAEITKLISHIEKLDKNSASAIKTEKDFEPVAMTYSEWISKSRETEDMLKKVIASKPNVFFSKLGFAKKWPSDSVQAINLYYEFKASSRMMLRTLNSYIEELENDTKLPEIFMKLKDFTETFSQTRRASLDEMTSELNAVEEEIASTKLTIRSVRDEISAYNYSLPYGVKSEEIETISHMANIREYYTSLWKGLDTDDRKIMEFMESWTKRLDAKSEKDYSNLKQLYISNANVIGITCSQSGSREFTSLYPTFDVAIIDEVSKATPPELILSVLKAKKIVLVGDHKQLPPMVGADTYEEVASKLDIPSEKIQHMKSSLFEELFTGANPQIKTMLSTQYRMHNQIMDTINQFYIEENGYGLRCGLPSPDTSRAHMCHGKAIEEKSHAIWVDVPMFEENREERSSVNHSYSNKAEIECIRNILLTINENLKANNFEGKKKIGLISFYSNQVRLMENAFHNRAFAQKADKLSLRIGSVDRFQGIECPVVICSFVRNNSRGEIGFAKDPRRVNVALSRAQELSIIVGCSELFCEANNDSDATAIYKTISKYIYTHGGERSEWDFN